MDGYLDAAATYLQANPLVGGAIGLVLLFLLIRKTKTFLFLLLLAAIVGGVLLLILDLAGKGGASKTRMINQTGSQDVR